jgi:DNA-binding NarL/FixJ family response regulator
MASAGLGRSRADSIRRVGQRAPDFVEVWSSGPVRLVPLDDDQITVGREEESSIVLAEDGLASRFHAVLQRYPTGWAVRDLGSTNGTYVNGQRVIGERTIRAGDEVRVGRSRLVMRAAAAASSSRPTMTEAAAPNLTRREADVLIALCWPVLHGEPFAPAATVADIAATLHVSLGAVKTHLSNLYDKFGLHDSVPERRAQLAREAINRHAVDVGDLPSGFRPPG